MDTQILLEAERLNDVANQAKATSDEKTKAALLAQLYETLITKRPQLIPRFLPVVYEFSLDVNSPSARLFAASFLESAIQLDGRLIKQAGFFNCLLRFVDDPVVCKKAVAMASMIFPLGLKLILMDGPTEDSRALFVGLSNLKDSVVSLLVKSSVATQVRVFKFIETVILSFIPTVAPSPLRRAFVFDLSECPEQHPFINRQVLQEQGEAYLTFLLQRLLTSSPQEALPACVASTAISAIANIACSRIQLLDKIVPVMLRMDPVAPTYGLVGVQVRTVRKTLQLALLRLIRLGESAMGKWDSDVEDAVMATGGQKQLEKVRRNIKEGGDKRPVREEYDWEPEDEPSTTGQVAAFQQQQQPTDLPQNPLQQMMGPAVYVPPDLVLQDMSVLAEVAGLINEMSIEQVVESIIDNMSLWSAVGAKPGDEGYVLTALARDPRATEERKARRQARTALIGRLQDGLAVPALDEAGYQRMWSECVMRILENEDVMRKKGTRGSRMRAALLARLLAGKPLDDEVCRNVLLNITNDFQARYPLAVCWLHEEFRVEGFIEKDEQLDEEPTIKRQKTEEGEGDEMEEGEEGEYLMDRKPLDMQKRYHYIIMQILDASLGTIDMLQDVFCKFVLEAPWLPLEFLKTLKGLAGDTVLHAVGLCLMATLAEKRPRYRFAGLDAMFEHSTSSLVPVRSRAIHECVALATRSAECRESIVAFAKGAFQRAALDPVLNVEVSPALFEEEVPAEQQQATSERSLEFLQAQAELRRLTAEKKALQARSSQVLEIARHASILFALAGDDMSLLGFASYFYTGAGSLFKREMLELTKTSVANAVSSWDKKEPATLITNLETFSSEPGVDNSLLLQALYQIADGLAEPPSEALVKFCRTRAGASGDVRLLFPVLRSMRGRDILSDVPRFMALAKESMQEFIVRALAAPYFVEKPADLMLKFHSVTTRDCNCDERELLLRQNDAIAMCFTHPRYTQEVMAVVLRKLAEQTPVHTLFMKTTMQATKKFPELLSWVQSSLLPKLINARAWKDPVLWKGFVKFCVGTINQGSESVLLRLPPDVMKEVLDDEPSLLAPLRKYVKEHPKSAGTSLKRLLRK